MSAESELRVKYSSKKHWVLQRRAMSPPGVYSRINPTKQRELPKQSAASEGGTGSKYLRTKSSGRRPIEILDDDDEFFPTRQAKRNSSQPTKKATVEVQIPAYRQAGNTTGYQGTSNMDPSRPRNKIRGNGDSQPSAEVSGYQGTPNNESSWPKNKIWGNGDSELPGEASGYQDTLNKECSPPKNGTETNGYSQLPAEPCRFVKYFPSAQSRTPTNSSNGTHSAHPPGARDRKMANSRLGNEIRSSVTSSSASGADGEDSAEEEIVTAGAQATLNNARPARTAPRPNIVYEGHRESVDREPSDEESEESESEESEAPSVEPEDSKPRHARFPPVEELPDWFPENIKQMYRVDRHGGALSYKELDEITRYRAALGIIYRRKWRKYIQAGRARWQLQQALYHLKCRPLTKPFYKYRKEQFRTWKAKGLRSWKRLEKTHRGILILEETININFCQERIIHEKKLGGGRI